MPEIKLFDFEGHDVRITDLDGGSWWILNDVCGVLTLGSPHKVAASLDDDEKGRTTVPTLGGSQEMVIINESGLYSLILRSRKPEAKRFKKWITSEVLPAIRKDGAYVVARPEDTPEIVMARGLVAAHEALERMKLEKAEARVVEYQPKVNAFMEIADANGLITFRTAAGALGVPERKFMAG